MDPLQTDIWSHLGQVTDSSAALPEAGVQPHAEPPSGADPAEPPSDQRLATAASRRRFDRGGRRRIDWPEDAGMTGCPGCGHESLQSLGALDSGDYLWQCPQCDRRFQTGRATRTLL
jgi:hypothetical protein